MLPGGILQIQGVEQEDAGSYRCVATNIGSRRKSSEAVLTVTPGEIPQIHNADTNVSLLFLLTKKISTVP